MANEAARSGAPIVVCDAIKALGVHNGVARIEFVRLLPDGTHVPSLQLLIPTAVVAQLVDTLRTIQS